MKRILFGLTALLGSQSAPHAAEAPKPYQYEGRIAGVVCSACAASVKEALMGLEGVKDVRITVTQDGSAPRLEITSTSPHLTREAAMKALGSAAADYHVQSLQKVPAK
ncbi:heavy-metal-associated domain-containing protein [Prosthecobacter sp.]|jgi:copper chaperone CopZ|uniref:heavy-metal-associated domain-containing protein n=1 Tax=Prosthecobacter sp. TaxID=1965333 RepID=UPI003782EE2A